MKFNGNSGGGLRKKVRVLEVGGRGASHKENSNANIPLPDNHCRLDKVVQKAKLNLKCSTQNFTKDQIYYIGALSLPLIISYIPLLHEDIKSTPLFPRTGRKWHYDTVEYNTYEMYKIYYIIFYSTMRPYRQGCGICGNRGTWFPGTFFFARHFLRIS